MLRPSSVSRLASARHRTLDLADRSGRLPACFHIPSACTQIARSPVYRWFLHRGPPTSRRSLTSAIVSGPRAQLPDPPNLDAPKHGLPHLGTNRGTTPLTERSPPSSHEPGAPSLSQTDTLHCNRSQQGFTPARSLSDIPCRKLAAMNGRRTIHHRSRKTFTRLPDRPCRHALPPGPLHAILREKDPTTRTQDAFH